VQAIVGEGQRTADREAGVVDEDVHGAVLDRDLLGEPSDVVHVTQVGRVRDRRPAARGDLFRGRSKSLLGARDEQDLGARLAELEGKSAADPGRGPRDQDDSTAHRLA
jgi:hypothetical protein